MFTNLVIVFPVAPQKVRPMASITHSNVRLLSHLELGYLMNIAGISAVE